MSDPLLQRLRLLDTASVSDAMDKLGLAGVVNGLRQCGGVAGGGRLAGRALTVKLGMADPSHADETPVCSNAIESGGSEHVIVIEQRTGIDAACWGGLLTLGATMRGIQGVIVEGAIRDVDEASEYHFPIYSRGLAARSFRGRLAEAGNGVPVRIGAEGQDMVTVHAGDYVLADRTGVAFIPAARIGQVLSQAEAIVARETDMLRAILGGEPLRLALGGYPGLVRPDPA